MIHTSNQRAVRTLAAVAITSVACLTVANPARAGIITFNTFSDSADALAPAADAIFGTGTPATGLTTSAPTFTFQDSGIQVTFSDPGNQAGDAVSRSDTNLGTCLGGFRPAKAAVCGNPISPVPQINTITLKFNQTVKLISTSGVMRSVVGDYNGDNIIASIWQTPGMNASFSYTNPENTSGSGAYLNPYSSSFNDFIAQANTPVTITTNFTQGYMDYWMQELKVQTIDVPGPLPLMGLGSAFAFSRRIRRRINAVSRIKLK
jgi:hypothetical protein